MSLNSVAHFVPCPKSLKQPVKSSSIRIKEVSSQHSLSGVSFTVHHGCCPQCCWCFCRITAVNAKKVSTWIALFRMSWLNSPLTEASTTGRANGQRPPCGGPRRTAHRPLGGRIKFSFHFQKPTFINKFKCMCVFRSYNVFLKRPKNVRWIGLGSNIYETSSMC